VEVEFNAGVTLYSGAPADLVMIRDITESKRTAAVIRVQKELLENTIESLAHPFYVIDVKDYTIQMTNSAARKLGATSASTCYALTHQSDTPCEGTDHTCPLIEVKETRKPVVLEHIHYDTNGKPVFFELHSYPILDVDGNVVQMIEYSLDITERKRAEQALQESEERFRATFEQAAVGIAHVAPEGGFLRLNRKFCEIVGYSPEEMLARTFQDITHPDDLDADLEQVRRLLAGEAEFYSIEKRYVRRNGEIVWVNLTVSLLWEGTGEPRYYVSVVEDITRRKLVEQQVMEYQRRLQALASQLTLAEERERHRIARELHDEVGQTLAYARMRLASARKATSDARRETILEDASQSLRQAIGDTRDLVFDLSSPLMDEVGLATALEEWLEEQVSKKHGIQTEFVHDGQRLPLDDDLRAILFRSVRELLTNVIKHAQAKRVNVRLEGEGMLVRIVVKDDGIGFDADAIPEAMERGAGFGLFSIQERMADLGGSLEVTSEPGHGCTAILTVPTTMD
jgi:two-component system sensor histidine kinase UhpB